MGYVTMDITLVPADGRDWYVFMLDDGGRDPFREEVRNGFDFMVAKSGPRSLIVKGVDQDYFFSQVYKLYKLEGQGFDIGKFPLPALFVTDMPPREVIAKPANIEKAKMIVIPLKTKYFRPGDITDFFKVLLNTIQDPEAILALDDLDNKTIRDKWEWLSKYVEFTPHFFGFDIHVNDAIRDFFLPE